jgi:hypothetical protein
MSVSLLFRVLIAGCNSFVLSFLIDGGVTLVKSGCTPKFPMLSDISASASEATQVAR